MISRLKFDIGDLIDAVFSKFPIYIWESENITFCDLQMGGGQFIQKVVEWKRKFRHSDETINDTVFGFSENPFYLEYVKSNPTLIGNFDVYKEDINMKIDVNLGNPPYQKVTNLINSNNNKQGSFWWEVIETALDKCEPNIISYTVPTSLFSMGAWGTSHHKITSLYNRGYKITHVWVNCNSYFKGIGIPISSFIAQKTESTLCELVDKNQLIDVDYSKPFPFLLDMNTFSILNKCFSGDNWDFREINHSNAEDVVIQINGGRFKQYKKLFIGYSEESPHSAQTLILDPQISIESVKSVFKSKLFEFIFKIYGGESGQSSTGILKKLPKVELDRTYTDTDLYTEFKLTPEEINYIENYVG
jgi:hypothetical protein